MRSLRWIGLALTVALGFGWVAFENYAPPPSLEDVRLDPCRGLRSLYSPNKTLDVCAMDGEAMDIRADTVRERWVLNNGMRVLAREFTVEILGRARSPFVPVGARTRMFSFAPFCPGDSNITLQHGHRYLLMVRWDDNLGGYRLEWDTQSVFEVHDGRLSPLDESWIDLDVEGHTPAAFLARVRAVCLADDRHPVRRKYRLPKVELH